MTTCKHCGARLSRPPQARQSRCLDWLVTRCYFQPFFVYHSKCLKTITMADFQQICHPHILPKSLSETALKEYKEKTVEVVGEKKEQAIRDAVARDKLEKAQVTSREFIITGKGETPCFDPLTNSCFKADIEILRKAENVLNKRMRDEMVITVNDFLQEIGLDPCDDAIGENMGWDIDEGYIDLDFSSQLVEGIPYLVIGHHNPPRYIGR